MLSNALKRSNFDKVEREAEIMSHAFFAELDWEDLQEQSIANTVLIILYKYSTSADPDTDKDQDSYHCIYVRLSLRTGCTYVEKKR